MKKLNILIFVLILCAYLPAYSLISEGSDAPDFTLTDINGVSHTLSDYAGTVVLIDLFSVDCTPCQREAEFFESLYQDFRDRNFVILAIDIEALDTEELILFYAPQFGFTFPVIWDQLGLVPSLYDYNGNLPTTILVGRDQKVAKVVEGYHDELQFRTWIDVALTPEQEQVPRVTITSDKPVYTMYEDWMKVFLEVSNPGNLLTVDLVVALYHLPTGALEGNMWFYPDWGEEMRTFRVALPPGFIMTKTRIVLTPVPSLYPGTPPVTGTGEYIWGAAFFKQGSLEPISNVSLSTVLVQKPSIPLSSPQTKPTIAISTDKAEYIMHQDTMDLFLECENPGSDLPVDLLFVLLHMPAGSLTYDLWFFPNWRQGVEVVQLTLPAGFKLDKTLIMQLDVPTLQIPGITSPPINETGEYIWAVALSKQGTIVEWVSEISTAPVMITEGSIPSN